jgi:hypothetical protein
VTSGVVLDGAGALLDDLLGELLGEDDTLDDDGVSESVSEPQAASPTASGTSKAMAAIRAVRPGLVRRAVVRDGVVTRVPSGTAVRRTGECGAGPHTGSPCGEHTRHIK